MHDDEIVRVRSALVCLYGAVASVMRHDANDAHLLLADLRESFEDIDEVLVAISLATLERLEAAVGSGPSLAPQQGRPIAQELLGVAHGYGVARVGSIQSAAWRLDAIRQGDHEQAMADITSARGRTTDAELVFGAVALLAATVVLWARRTGQSPNTAITDLCLAAALTPAA